MTSTSRPWTEADFQHAKKLRAAGLSDELIGRAMNRSMLSVRNKLGYRTIRKATGEPVSGSMRVSPSLLTERDRRAAAREQLDQAGRLFGDPPPGYSALDRRRA
jgi:hypothetical protein